MASGLYFTVIFCMSGGLWTGAKVGPEFAKAQKLALNPISTHRVITCDDADNVQHLSCEIGVIDVESALYGRIDRKTCSEGKPKNQLTNTHCSQEGTLEVFQKRCNGLEVCEINGNVVRTSDPCFGIYKYIDTTYSCVSPASSTVHSITCENSLAYLQCEEGQVLHVFSADYGRSDSTTCSYQRPDSQVLNVDCSRTSDKVAARCNGKSSCTFQASNSVFGDPCEGTYKYLTVDYTCQLVF
ncbi:L-rhamnose-binding lectin CSL2-like [Nematolebias whitei]|uniref:L-rhamnose-binding lectin CSL2-like n=1 Tax=Nematolebias whitei TaxID=451745 RepID=UPI00189A9F2D|nr:L-rhamnose-binding lectin CSL2-like [Nematolebias whitei]